MNIFRWITTLTIGILLVVVGLGSMLVSIDPVLADLGSDINNQLQATAGQNGGNLGSGIDPRLVAADIIRQTLTFLGTLMLAYTFWGGWLILSAAGDSEQVGKGKKALTRAVIGLVIILSSYSITLAVANLIQVDTKPVRQIPNNDRQQQEFINNDPLNQDATPFVF